MDEQLKTKLMEYLAKMEAAAGKVGEFAEVEIPDTIREYIRWIIIENSIFTAAGLIPIIAWFCLQPSFKRWWAWASKGDTDLNDAKCACLAAYFFSLSLCVVVLSVCFLKFGITAIKAYTSPRVVLLEKASDFIKR